MAADDGGEEAGLAGVVAALARIEGRLTVLSDLVLTRLLDAVVPTPEQRAAEERAPGARDLGDDDVADEMAAWDGGRDWTDPFIGLDRPRSVNEVARLEAGEGVPFVAVPEGQGATTVGALDRWRETGASSFDEWNRETHLPDTGMTGDAAAWVNPLEV